MDNRMRFRAGDSKDLSVPDAPNQVRTVDQRQKENGSRTTFQRDVSGSNARSWFPIATGTENPAQSVLMR